MFLRVKIKRESSETSVHLKLDKKDEAVLHALRNPSKASEEVRKIHLLFLLTPRAASKSLIISLSNLIDVRFIL